MNDRRLMRLERLAELFDENGGPKADRARLRRLLDQLAPIDQLMVTRLDRLARSTHDLLNLLAAVIERKAGFLSLGDPGLTPPGPTAA